MAEFPQKLTLQGPIGGYVLLNSPRESWGHLPRHYVCVWFNLLFLSFSSFTPSRLSEMGQTAVSWGVVFSHFKGQPL